MAKQSDTVEVPVKTWEQVQARLEALELAERVRAEKADDPLRPRAVYDAAWEQRQAEVGRPAAERTQLLADRRYGTDRPRWRVALDSTREDGRPGPNVSEHPALELSANSPEEAEGRWRLLCGVRAISADYRMRVEPVAAAATA